MHAFLEEYALIGAIGLPIALVAVANVYLALTDPRGRVRESPRSEAPSTGPAAQTREEGAAPGAPSGA